MRIITTIVPPLAHFTPRDNPARLALGLEILARAAEARADLLVLPSGFLRAAREAAIEEVARDLLDAARAKLAIVLGVDVAPPATKATRAPGRLPYHVVAQPRGGTAQCWRQRSSTSANGATVPRDELARRTLRVRGTDVDVLACGEVFNHPLREAAKPWRGRTIVVPTHTARGSRFFHAFAWAKTEGAACLLRATTAKSPDTDLGEGTVAEAALAGAYLRRWER